MRRNSKARRRSCCRTIAWRARTYLLKTADNDKFYPAVDAKWSSGELPALFLYDRSGKKVRSFFGETSIADLEAAISKLL